MKKTVFSILLFGLSIGVFAASDGSSQVTSMDGRPCLKWKKVCHQEQHCLYRESSRAGCFRCVKPNYYGFHLYPGQIDRNTCSLSTVHYLRTMGYRCYQPYGSQRCATNSAPVKKCDLQCVSYGKEPNE